MRGWMLTLLLLAAGATGVFAQTTQGQNTENIVKGSGQQEGGDALLNQTYTLFLSGKEQPALNLTLTRAEYSLGPVADGNGFFVLAPPDKKFLVLHFDVQNPNATERYTNGGGIPTVVVDHKNQNWTAMNTWADAQSGLTIDTGIKPAQKLKVTQLVEIPADVSIPKLILSDENNKVWRYDLRDKIVPLPAPYADPASKDGSVALETVKGKMGQYLIAYPMLRLDGLKYSQTARQDIEPEEGKKLLEVTLTLKCPTLNCDLGEAVDMQALDRDGVALAETGQLLQFRPSSDKFQAFPDLITLKRDQEMGVKAFLQVPADEQPVTLKVVFPESRTFLFDLTGVK